MAYVSLSNGIIQCLAANTEIQFCFILTFVQVHKEMIIEKSAQCEKNSFCKD